MTRVLMLLGCLVAATLGAPPAVHVWELQEIVLHASRTYANPYVDVETWVELKGPGFAGRVYGFWDGGDIYRVRVVATAPGDWSWTSGSNQPSDTGLNGRTGGFTARAWTEDEKRANPNRRGFLRPTANGHAAHVSSAADCEHCHAGTVTSAGTAILATSTLHLDKARDVQILAAYDTNGASPNYTQGSKTCNNVSCHGSGSPTWGGPKMKCSDCHAGTADTDSFAFGTAAAGYGDTVLRQSLLWVRIFSRT